jgi:hypothetical protein
MELRLGPKIYERIPLVAYKYSYLEESSLSVPKSKKWFGSIELLLALQLSTAENYHTQIAAGLIRRVYLPYSELPPSHSTKLSQQAVVQRAHDDLSVQYQQ